MGKSIVLLGHLLLCFVCFTIVIGHPQCLDFRPPFEPQEPFQFCMRYQDFGCCTKENDTNINLRYARIIQDSYNEGPFDECKDYLRDILCEECSPYAAHVYDAESDLQINAFPGLCRNYCSIFYSKCRYLVKYITSDPDVLQSLASLDQFCSEIRISDTDYCYPELNTNVDLNREISRETRNEDGCMCLEPFAENLRNPLAFRVPPDDSDRLFISEQLGIVHIFYRNKTRVPDHFMDLSNVVLSSSSPGDERGFLNLAFHPDFSNNQKFYVYFSIRQEGRFETRLSEFSVSSSNKNKANRNSEQVILEIPQPYSNHNGGELMFGVDGFLYLSLGDGGAGGDPLRSGQNKSTLLGAIIRIDVDRQTDGRAYAIPPDNPFVDEAGSRPEIYAYGIRNIWRCDVDDGDPVTGANRGRIFCGDVGQSRYEEIDIIEKGGNYGWNAKEGFECYRGLPCGNIGPVVDPIYAYDHSVGKSITGGHVYRGCENPNLNGKYIYGDYVDGKIFALTEGSDGSWTNREITMCGTDICINNLVNQYPRNILSFGEDADGEVFVLTTSYASSTSNSGKVFKLIDPKRRGDPTTCRTYKETQEETTTEAPTTTTPPINSDLCDPNPCQNGGTCSTSENPYGVGYECYCDYMFGGRHCQIIDPCGPKPIGTWPCPPLTDRCRRTSGHSAGRFCYTAQWIQLDPL